MQIYYVKYTPWIEEMIGLENKEERLNYFKGHIDDYKDFAIFAVKVGNTIKYIYLPDFVEVRKTKRNEKDFPCTIIMEGPQYNLEQVLQE